MSSVRSSSGSAPFPLLHRRFGHSLLSGVEQGQRRLCLMRSDQSVRGSPKSPHPTMGSQPGRGSAFPALLPIPTCCRLAVAAAPRVMLATAAFFCGVSTHFPPSFSSDWQENLGLAQPPCLPLTATTPPWIPPCLSHPHPFPASSLLTLRWILLSKGFCVVLASWGCAGWHWRVSCEHSWVCPLSPCVSELLGPHVVTLLCRTLPLAFILAWPFCCTRHGQKPSVSLGTSKPSGEIPAGSRQAWTETPSQPGDIQTPRRGPCRVTPGITHWAQSWQPVLGFCGPVTFQVCAQLLQKLQAVAVP